jgi:hypothetical protein
MKVTGTIHIHGACKNPKFNSIQFNSLFYLHAFSIAYTAIIKLARAIERNNRTHRHNQNTKQGNFYHLHNSNSISIITQILCREKK